MTKLSKEKLEKEMHSLLADNSRLKGKLADAESKAERLLAMLEQVIQILSDT